MMKTINHDSIEAMMPYYTAGTLPAEQRLLVEAHLLECDVCSAALVDWRRIAAAVRENVPQTVILPPLKMPLPTRRTVPYRLRYLAAAALIVIIGAFLFPGNLLANYGAANPTPTLIPTATLVPAHVTAALPDSVHANYKWEPQSWNDSGPANLVQVLRHFGWNGTQREIQQALKPNPNDKHVTPQELVDYVNERTPFHAIYRLAGNTTLLKEFVAADVGVIVHIGYDIAGVGWFSHYLTLQGYENRGATLFFADTFLGIETDRLGRRYEESQLDTIWQNFNRGYIVIYPMKAQPTVTTILGNSDNFLYTVNLALDNAKAEIAKQPDNAFAWLNFCQSEAYLADYSKAAVACGKAFAFGTLPPRVLWFNTTPLEVYFETKQYERVLEMAQSTIQTTHDVEEVFYWQGMAYRALGQHSLAIQAFKFALIANPNDVLARMELNEMLAGTLEF